MKQAAMQHDTTGSSRDTLPTPIHRHAPIPLEISGLTKRFGSFVAVDDVTFTVPHGSIFGFLGPNGSGKTTTIGMVLGLMPRDAGTARILGYDIEHDLSAALSQVGALVERPALYPYLSGRRNLQVIARLAGVKDPDAVEQALDTVDLLERADAKFSAYSQGMKQRLGIAAALINDPQLLILDEPTNGLDPAGQREIRALIHRLADEGKTVIFSSHILSEVQELCTHLAIIDRGSLIVTGRMEELLAFEEGLVLGVDRMGAAQEVLRTLPIVRSVREMNGFLEIEVDPREAVSINRHLVEAGIGVYELRPHIAGLEERFLALTGQYAGKEGHS